MAGKPFDPTTNSEPFVLRKTKVSDWPCYQWTTQDWFSNCSGLKLAFRLHFMSDADIPWENEADTHISSTLEHFSQWRRSNGESPQSDENPFSAFDSKNFWAYSSYNHLAKLPQQSCQPLIDSIKWSSIDFGSNLGDNGMSSTLWIGSKGAVTPCHYDTYGYNIVAQIVGKKLWILFSPDDTSKMYPTRLPFEESSVFSEVNIENADYTKHPKFRETHPFIVILEPGDVLYVPHHWWHYVKCIDDGTDGLCISINQWLPLVNNNFDSLCEAITSLLVSTLFPFHQPSNENWLNGEEENETILDDPSLVMDLISKLSSNSSDLTGNIDRWIDYVPERCEQIKPIKHNQLNKLIFSTEPKDYIEIGKMNNQLIRKNEISVKNIIKCFLKPNVVQLIAQNIMDEAKNT